MKTGVWAMIGDLVGSRSAPSREHAHDELVLTLKAANELVSAIQPLEPTIGDEFQAVFATVEEAIAATIAVRLLLPHPMDARFGLGHGEVKTVGTSRYGLVQDGSAWWTAREAIDLAKQREAKLPGTRTVARWSTTGDEMTAPEKTAPEVAPEASRSADLVNAYLACRDELISAGSARQRRIGAGVLRGLSQRQIAEDEGISPSAVSQALRASGLATVVATAPTWS